MAGSQTENEVWHVLISADDMKRMATPFGTAQTQPATRSPFAMLSCPSSRRGRTAHHLVAGGLLAGAVASSGCGAGAARAGGGEQASSSTRSPAAAAAATVSVPPPAAQPPIVAAPPRHCLDPRNHAIEYWQEGGEETVLDADVQIVTTADWDADGAGEVLVAWTALCGATGNCSYMAYLSNDGCPRQVGQLHGAVVQAGRERHHGVLDVSVYGKGGCAGTAGGYEFFRFDGEEFQVFDTVPCACVDEHHPPSPTRDPRCPEP